MEEVLKRWWYCLPEWPPTNFDYDKALKEKGLRKVELSMWRIASDDENGI